MHVEKEMKQRKKLTVKKQMIPEFSQIDARKIVMNIFIVTLPLRRWSKEYVLR